MKGHEIHHSHVPELTLSRYGRDLVSMAEEGKLDPVIGRDEEIRRVIQVRDAIESIESRHHAIESRHHAITPSRHRSTPSNPSNKSELELALVCVCVLVSVCIE